MRQREHTFTPRNDPLWYRDAIIYEVHVRAFHDSGGDGVGDFRGLAQKLDYLQDLGITAIWLLPFYPSPLRDDGYDIADYTGVHPAYGNLQDARQFVREAHRRGLRVITELVCNHTSSEHPWFQRARRAEPGSSHRDFYVWSDTADRYQEARIIFKDFEGSNWSWDPVARAHYWHRFYSHQPDLNYDNPHVRKAIFQIMDFWLRMGVDGLRLDAVPYLYEREGTNCENLPEGHTFLKSLRRHVDERFEGRMLLAEANQWPEQAVAYFGGGDEAHMAFHFPLMPRLFMALRMEDRFPITDILAQTPAIPESCQWAIFLRNHDELTLEMVSDEERDYMYRVYARDPEARINLGIRRRLAPLLGNHRRRIELMNGLLFSLPGTPVIYYGDEIGMGDNIYLGDRNGVRTPMQWSADRNAGFSQANPQRLYLPVIVDPEYHFETVNVEAQQNNAHSLLWWMKRLIALRKRYRAFSRGSLEFLHPENRRVLAFLRRYREETVLVVANLSRFVQYVELDLSGFRGTVPVETFGRTEFPPVGDQPYFLTLGPHNFFWFSLEPQRVAGDRVGALGLGIGVATLAVASPWEVLFEEKGRAALAEVLPGYLRVRRWFGGKARRIKSARILDAILVPYDGSAAYIAVVQVDYREGEAESYLLPLAYADGERARSVARERPHAVIAHLALPESGKDGILYDAVTERGFCQALLRGIAGRRHLKGVEGELLPSTTPAFRRAFATGESLPEPSIIKAEQSNTSMAYGDRFILKLFRRMEGGANPDLEIGRFLTGRDFAHAPAVYGALEYRRDQGEPTTVAILHRFVPNQGDAWRYTMDALSRYFEQAAAAPEEAQQELRTSRLSLSTRALLDLAEKDPPPPAVQMIGAYLESARLLGERTAEMHRALAADPRNPAFSPEPFSTLYQRSIYQAMRSLAGQVFQTLRRGLKGLPEQVLADAEKVLALEGEVLNRFQAVLDRKITAVRIRCHGDYHLGQVLYTGSDFHIIDFEGEPARPLSERRIKRSPLRDVAGMLRSFHYASYAPLVGQVEGVVVRPEDFPSLEPWTRLWCRWVGTAFLGAYLDSAADAPFVPQDREELQLLLDAFLVEKAIYELGYELDSRPDWVAIPTRGILQLLEGAN